MTRKTTRLRSPKSFASRTAKWALVTLAGCAIAAIVVVAVACALSTPPVKAQSPVGDALATLAAATAQAQAQQAAQRATAAAVNAEGTRQANNAQATARALSAEATRQAQSVQATAQAQSAQATQSALDELNRQRAATATAAAMNIAATQTAQQATATAQAMNAQATATSQAVAIAAQATDTAKLSATYAQRQERFSLALLVIEIGMIAGALWVLWKLAGTLSAWAVKMRPPAAAEPTLSTLIAAAAAGPSAGTVVIDQAQASTREPEPEPRLPSFVQVVDNPAMEAAISRWAERYDAEHGGGNGNN